MPKLRAATPADGRAVWDSIVKAGRKPTVRNVADALKASGKFKSPPTYGTIQRWKKRGWTEPKGNARPPKLDEAAAKLDAAVPVLTGDPKTRIESVNGTAPPLDPEAAADAALRKELMGMADARLIQHVVREVYITIGLISGRMQRNLAMVVELPREVGSLQAALAGSMREANAGFQQVLDIQRKLIDITPSALDQVEEDSLKGAFDAYEAAKDDDGG